MYNLNLRMDSNFVLEPLSFYFKDEPLYQIFVYMIKLNKYSVRGINHISNDISTIIKRVRKQERGKTLFDNIIIGTIQLAMEDMNDLEESLVEELLEYVNIHYPSIGRRSL